VFPQPRGNNGSLASLRTILAVGLLAAAPAARQGVGQTTPPTFRAGIDLRQIDVSVLKKKITTTKTRRTTR